MQCRVRDLDVHCEVFGEGRLIVSVHGMGVDLRTMKGCMEPVFADHSDAWKRVYFDLAGMGQTRAPDWIHNSDGMLEFVLAVIDEILGSEPFALVGESYGGYLARGVVREKPKQVLGLLLLCPLVVPADEARDVPPFTAPLREPALEGLGADTQEFVDRFLTRQTPETWRRFRDEMLCGFETGDGAFTSRIRAHEAYAFAADVDAPPSSYSGPTLILTGRQDRLVGYRDAWRILERFPRASYAVLDMAGHGLQIEQPELFAALVGEWLLRVAAAGT